MNDSDQSQPPEESDYAPRERLPSFMTGPTGADDEVGGVRPVEEPTQAAESNSARDIHLVFSESACGEASTDDRPSVPETVTDETRQIGNYRLLQRIGAGGMGEVWVAEQTHPVKRRVALKLIKGGLGSKEILARFNAERQALALMNHPNIARILDAGTTKDEQPYFVMEWINGKSLTRYCDENRLGIVARLHLFLEVCSGVQHAHQKGIIHRDLKPGNIIVGMQDGRPTPKIIDFGLAKALESTHRLTDQSLFTGIGQILGTLRYMSPEQASLDNLDIDTRSDIYALGVILYELLTGSTPLDESSIKGQAALKVLEIIRDKEPVRPSSRLSSCSHELVSAITGQRQTDSVRLRRILIGDLDWIVMKALEKDRTRRYESASGFAADVLRYMNSEPVVARPPSVNYRLRKFVRKNRVGVVATSIVLLALFGGLIGTSLGRNEAIRQTIIAQEESKKKEAALVEEQRQRQEAEKQKRLAEQQTQRAQAAEALAEDRLQVAERNLAFARQGNKILGAVFWDLDPRANYREVSELRNAITKNLSQAVAQLQAGAIGEPLDVAEMQHTLGRSLVSLGETDHAVEVLEQALSTYNTVVGPDHSETLECMNSLGSGLKSVGRSSEAIDLWEQVLEKLRAAPDPDTLLILSVMINMADSLLELGQVDKALAMNEESLKLTRANFGPDDPNTLISLNNLAASYRAVGRIDQALPLLIESYERHQASMGPDHPDTLGSINNLASGYRAVGQVDKAMPMYQLAVERRKAILGPSHPDTLISINNLAVAYLSTGRADLALPLFEETYNTRIEKLGADHPDTLLSMHNLAGTYSANGKRDQAFPLWKKALDGRMKVFGPEHPETIATMESLAKGYLENQQPVEAMPLLERAAELAKSTFGPQHPTVLGITNSLAVAYRRAGQVEKSLPLLELVLKARTARFGAEHPSTLLSVHNLADGYLAAKRVDDVVPLLEILRSKLGPDHDFTMNTTNNLATEYWSAKRSDLAIPLFETLLQVQEEKFGRQHLETQFTLGNLGVNYFEAGRVDEAMTLLDEVVKSSRTQAELAWVRKKVLGFFVQLQRVEDFRSLANEDLELARENLSAGSTELALALISQGELYLRLGQASESSALLREGYEMTLQHLSTGPLTLTAQSLLGAALGLQAVTLEQGGEREARIAEAEMHLVGAYSGIQALEASSVSEKTAMTVAALDRLIRFYESLGKTDEQEKYRKLRDQTTTNDK